MNNFFDVIIIGFGPTGGTLASLLAKSNLSVLMLEKEKSLYPLPRAVHFDDEIMSCLLYTSPSPRDRG